MTNIKPKICILVREPPFPQGLPAIINRQFIRRSICVVGGGGQSAWGGEGVIRGAGGE
jgi:hypothetical protein